MAKDAALADVGGAGGRRDRRREGRSERIKAAIAKLGENVVLKRVARLAVPSGVVGGYVHAGGKLGVLVALRERRAGPALEALAKDVSMHVAAADPSPVAVTRDGVLGRAARDASARSTASRRSRRASPRRSSTASSRGRSRKFLSEVCLVDQAYVKDPDKTDRRAARRGRRASRSQAFERFRLGQARGGGRGVKAAYRRILVKLSGEQLAGSSGFGISPTVIRAPRSELREVHELGVQICVVIGGGNVIRGMHGGGRGHGPHQRRLHGHAGAR